MALNTGAFASIGLAGQQKLLEMSLGVENSIEEHDEIDVAGATPKLDQPIQNVRAFLFAGGRVCMCLLHSDLNSSLVQPVLVR